MRKWYYVFILMVFIMVMSACGETEAEQDETASGPTVVKRDDVDDDVNENANENANEDTNERNANENTQATSEQNEQEATNKEQKADEKNTSDTSDNNDAKQSEANKDERANDWSGEWYRNDQFFEGELVITNVQQNSFELKLDAFAGARTTSTAGTASVSGHEATFTDEVFDCTLNMELNDSNIEVQDSIGCTKIGGMGTFMGGTYDDTKKEPDASLADSDLITDEEDAKLRDLVGEHYESFTGNMMDIYEDEDLDGWDAKVVSGYVRGLVPTNTAIIMIDPDDHYYAATSVDVDNVYYYTNNQEYEDKVPETIKDWVDGLLDQSVKKVYKDIGKD